jgi:hypothetical protein
MRNRLVATAIMTLGLLTALATAGQGVAVPEAAGPVLVPQAFQAPDLPGWLGHDHRVRFPAGAGVRRRHPGRPQQPMTR